MNNSSLKIQEEKIQIENIETPDEQFQEIQDLQQFQVKDQGGNIDYLLNLETIQEEDLTPQCTQERENLIQECQNKLEYLLQCLQTNTQPPDHEYQQLISQLNPDDLKIYNLYIEKQQSYKQEHKRKEEKQKMFFKKAFKGTWDKFHKTDKLKKQSRIGIKKLLRPESFYIFYFQDISTLKDIQINNFYHPDKKFGCQNFQSGNKSFNQGYINLILKSKLFLKEVKHYLQNDFLKDVQKSRSQKIKKFINKCYQIIKTENPKQLMDTSLNDFSPKNYCNLKKYILQDRNCKVPWTDDEINQLVQYANQIINEAEQEN